MKYICLIVSMCLIGCEFAVPDKEGAFGFAYNEMRAQRCLPKIEKGMKAKKINDSVILYTFGRLDTTRSCYHFNKWIFIRKEHIIEEEDEFFLPTNTAVLLSF